MAVSSRGSGGESSSNIRDRCKVISLACLGKSAGVDATPVWLDLHQVPRTSDSDTVIADTAAREKSDSAFPYLHVFRAHAQTPQHGAEIPGVGKT